MTLPATALQRLERLGYHARIARGTANVLREEVEHWRSEAQKNKLNYEITARSYPPVVLDGPVPFYVDQAGNKREIAQPLTTFARLVHISSERQREAQANFNTHQQQHTGLNEMVVACERFARDSGHVE